MSPAGRLAYQVLQQAASSGRAVRHNRRGQGSRALWVAGVNNLAFGLSQMDNRDRMLVVWTCGRADRLVARWPSHAGPAAGVQMLQRDGR